ncbi:hypothetical protein AB7W88_02550 [Providencia vermicola]|jgi:hypothetical protein|uniref:Uncharacterized protein n=6 Tax=Morganellaceae TaxID=1903414 RepID=A0A899NEV8_PROST|nr:MULTISPECIES: hypothetical protein [Enterobacterales]URQ57547.1 Hypothetical protein [Providencia alcalifaciens]EKH6496381.1 hypothetical protein [Providencia rettgeri]ELB1110328.1 hypothetical protein [Morganella morganii]ELL8907331.1 hypothetical protein [Proteus mirabilis]ELQ1457906.1 hypothetical protein [Providencia rettgeri]
MNFGTREYLINYLMSNFKEGQMIAIDTLTLENVADVASDLSLERALTPAEQVQVLNAVVSDYDVNTGAGFDHIRKEIAALGIAQQDGDK